MQSVNQPPDTLCTGEHTASPCARKEDTRVVTGQVFDEERALFGEHDVHLADCIFQSGESPLKHCSGVSLSECTFKWKYPLWYSSNVAAADCLFLQTARAGIWYTNGVSLSGCLVEAPKMFRRCHDVSLVRCDFPFADETLWSCQNVKLSDVQARGDYFAMNSCGVKAQNLCLSGNYPFDGACGVEVRSSKLISKDAFWNTRDVVVRDSYISGEYLAWNSTNVLFENCTIESLQGLCYVENLVMKNCRLLNTTLAFEYSSLEADIASDIESVINPASGFIKAHHINHLILQKDRVDPSRTKIICE